LTAVLCLFLAGAETPLVRVPNPAAALRPESDDQRQARHDEVSRARRETILMAHGGTATPGPDNTLSAIRSTLALGCPAVELDVRRTKDGALVLFPDERLEYRLDGFGTVEDSYYEELVLARRRDVPPAVADCGRVPVLADVLQLLRDRAGLVWLDVKTPKIDLPVLRALAQAEMVDQVIGYSQDNAQAFGRLGMPRLRLKGSLAANGAELDPAAVRAVLDRPGQVVLVDDARAALGLLGKPPAACGLTPVEPLSHKPPGETGQLEAVLWGQSKAVPVRLAAVRLAIAAPGRFVALAPELARRPEAEIRRAVAWNLGLIAAHRPALLDEPSRGTLVDLLGDGALAVRAEAAVACGRANLPAAAAAVLQRLTEPQPAGDGQPAGHEAVVEARGRYAYALGLLGDRGAAVATALTRTFQYREAGPNRMWLGVDGAMAAWSLGRLRVAAAVGLLREALLWEPPGGAADDDANGPPRWLVYRDLQVPRFLPEALRAIGTDEARQALEAAVQLSEAEAARRSPELLARTAEALARFPAEDRPGLLAGLLQHKSAAVRAAAVQECLRDPQPGSRALLAQHADWALPWWDAQHAAKP
jgi:hypothetical protein